SSSAHPLDLHSFPTRRSSDLAADEFGEFDYSRSGNPTRRALEEKLAQLEHGKFAAAFSSGMAAITAVIRLLAPGDEVIAGDELRSEEHTSELQSRENLVCRRL